MSERDLIIQGLLKNSIRFGQILLPIGTVESTLSRYTFPLVAANDDEVFPISLVGSSVAIKYADRYFVVCTRHQLKSWDLERISLLVDDGKYVISSGGVRQFTELNDSDFHDLTAFDFTEPCIARPFLRERFFELKELPAETSSEEVVFLIASGYPFPDQNFALEYERKLELRKRIVICTLDGSGRSRDEALMRIRAISPIDFDLDGMSGGGAFVVQMVSRVPHAFFGGIITRAGSDVFHFVKSPFIKVFLDICIERHAT